MDIARLSSGLGETQLRVPAAQVGGHVCARDARLLDEIEGFARIDRAELARVANKNKPPDAGKVAQRHETFLVVVRDHRSFVEDQDPVAANGYVQEAFVRQLAQEAGFVFVESSEINANPKDTKKHPFGVDTLPPTRLTAPKDQPADLAFDRAKFEAIGESDRMTLKFRKPE